MIFLAVWVAAIMVGRTAVGQALEHQRLSEEVRTLEVEYQHELTAYADVLAESDRIATDHDTQISYLKDKFGYTEPDETPIVILREE